MEARARFRPEGCFPVDAKVRASNDLPKVNNPLTDDEAKALGAADYAAGRRDPSIYGCLDHPGKFYRLGWQTARRADPNSEEPGWIGPPEAQKPESLPPSASNPSPTPSPTKASAPKPRKSEKNAKSPKAPHPEQISLFGDDSP